MQTTLKDFVLSVLSRRKKGEDLKFCTYSYSGSLVGQRAPREIKCEWDGENLRIGYQTIPGSTSGQVEGYTFVWTEESGSNFSQMRIFFGR